MSIPNNPFDRTTWVGRLIDARYQIENLIGQGGMGSVFLANDTRLFTRVVVKVPRLELFERNELRDRFTAEAQNLCRLSHAHIVRVIDVGEYEGVPYLVLPYLEGGNLSERREQIVASQGVNVHQFLLADVERWILPVAQALDALHRDGLIHRDVKPANILFDRHGQVYISDFGIAKFLYEQRPASEQTRTGAVPGTPEYMAPELLLGQFYDGRIDQYALAIVIYESISGICPFRGGTAPNVMMRQLTVVPDDLHLVAPGVGAGLSAVVRQGMSKDPKRRFGSSEQFARAILRQLELKSVLPISPFPPAAAIAVTPVNRADCPLDEFAVSALLPPRLPSGIAKLDSGEFRTPWYSWLAVVGLPFPAVLGCFILLDVRRDRIVNPIALFALAVFIAGWFTRTQRVMCDIAMLAVAVWFTLIVAMPFLLGYR